MHTGTKIILGIVGTPIALILGLTIYFSMTAPPADHYRDGVRFFSWGHYYNALEELSQVDTSHAQYDSAQIYLKWVKVKTDSIDRIASRKIKMAMADVSKILELTNKEFNQQIFTRCALRQSGRRCEISITNTWYYAERFQKEQILSSLFKAYSDIAERYKLKRDEYDNITVSLIDGMGIEVAYYSGVTGAHVK